MKTQCPECSAYDAHERDGAVITCLDCAHEWDVSVPANGSEALDEESDEFRNVLLFNEFGETLDGCTAYEVDGHCPHGYPAWTRHLGYV